MIKKIEIKNIRNINNFNHEIDNKIIIISGTNGSGKTSILESIFLLSTGKSFRTTDWKKTINSNSEMAYLSAKYKTRGIENNIILNLSQKKQIKLNGENSSFKNVLGEVHPVVLDQRTINDFKHNKKIRLALFDKLISIDKKIFSSILKEFNVVKTTLRQAKKNVKMNGIFIEVVSQKLSELEIELIKYRTEFENEVEDLFMDNCVKYINSELRIKYLPVKTPETSLRKLLQATTITVSSDDWKIFKNSNDYLKFGSEGQVRMAILIFVISYIELTKKKYDQEFPLLLDDVFNELDEKNINILIKILNDKNINAIITTQKTNLSIVDKVQKIKL